MVGWLFTWLVRLAPAAALLSLIWSFDDSLRWLGLLGFIPLALAFDKDCPSCVFSSSSDSRSGWAPWPGH